MPQDLEQRVREAMAALLPAPGGLWDRLEARLPAAAAAESSIPAGVIGLSRAAVEGWLSSVDEILPGWAAISLELAAQALAIASEPAKVTEIVTKSVRTANVLPPVISRWLPVAAAPF